MAKAPSATVRKRKPAAKAEAIADEPLTFDDDGIKRVQDIIRNARATWFALLGALVFASVTLAGVKDISFFVNSVETKLPVVGISVPVVSFFWAGSLLIAALYAYFHLYLELLWQALGDFPARDKKGALLADRIEPWIVADTALRFRDWLRGDTGDKSASRKRAMPWISGFVSLGLVWVFGLIVIFWFWWRSMPAHEPLLALFLGAVLWVTVFVFGSSLAGAWTHLKFENHEVQRPVYWQWTVPLVFVMIFGLTFVRTAEGGWFLASADLREAVFTEKPKDWQGKENAETEFRVRWCKERGEPKCANPLDREKRNFDAAEEKSFQAAWKERWTALLATFPKADLRYADMRGANLSSARLEGADLSGARLEGADLFDAGLEGADLSGARLEGASLWVARLDGANLSGARLENADLFRAGLEGADLSRARMEGAYLEDAGLEGANLSGAQLEGADLSEASMKGAVLRSARMEDADLIGASMEGADLSFARIFGKAEKPLGLTSANLTVANFRASALRFADVSADDMAQARNFQSSFGDATVKLPEGVAPPCQWGTAQLADAEYFGRWEGWLTVLKESDIDLQFDDYPPIPPPPGCVPPPAEP